MSSHLSDSPHHTGDHNVTSSAEAGAHLSLLDIGLDFGHSALYSGIQSPISGITQLVDEVANTHLNKTMSFISAPDQAKFGSADWHAQQLGGALGMVLPFLAIHKGMGAAFGDSALLANPVARSATSGLIYGSVFQPSSADDNFWSSRLKHGITSGVTFGAMTGVGNLIGRAGESEMLSGTFAQKLATNGIFTGVVSGAGAGLVGAEAESLIDGKGLARGQDLAQSAYSYAVVGGAFGALNRFDPANTAVAKVAESQLNLGTEARVGSESGVVQTKTPEFQPHGREGMEVVLGAGGVRGFGLVGFLRYLEDQHVKVGTETGVSIGSIVGALHTNGYSARQIEQIMKTEMVHSDMQTLAQTHQPLRHPLRSIASHFVNMRSSMEGFVDKYNLKPQENLRIVAYNLTSRKPIVFEGTNYNLAEALAASSAIPGAMRPVFYRPAKGELPESMRKAGLLVDGGAYRMAPSEFSDAPAIIAKISAQSPFPRFLGQPLREIPKLITPAIFAAFKKRYTEPSGPHLVVAVGNTAVDALDMHLPDVKINDLIDFGYKQAQSNLAEHVVGGKIPVEPVVFSTPAVEPVPTQATLLSRLFSRLHGQRSA